MPSWVKDVLIIFLTIIFPPIGVYAIVGFQWVFWFNLVLTILGYIPGLIHAIYVIAHRNYYQNLFR